MNHLESLAVFSTGGTFNKIYTPQTGTLDIDPEARAIRELMAKWLCDFELHPLIHKDSLEMTDADRETLTEAIRSCPREKILVVHGTDTMDQSAEWLERELPDRRIVLTGAMIPYSIDPVEASANFASALGWLLSGDEPETRIAMHGLILPRRQIVKDRSLGRFVSLLLDTI